MGEVASYASAIETDIDNLNASIRQQTDQARARLSTVYFISLVAGIAAVLVCTFLVFADLKLIKNYVVTPIKNILQTIQESSGHIHNMTVEVLKRTQASKGSAADLSALSQELSATIQEVASNAFEIKNCLHKPKETDRKSVV